MAAGRGRGERLTSHGLPRILIPQANTLIGVMNNSMSNDSGCGEINHGIVNVVWSGHFGEI